MADLSLFACDIGMNHAGGNDRPRLAAKPTDKHAAASAFICLLINWRRSVERADHD